MKNLNEKEFGELLGTIVKKAIFSEEQFKLYEEIMIKAPYWPEAASKQIALDFMAMKEITTFKAASRSLYPKAAVLTGDYEITDDILLIFQSTLNRFLFKGLGMSLLNKPEDGPKILAEFNVSNSSAIEWLNLKQVLAHEIKQHLNIVAVGDSRTIISKFPKLSKCIGGFNPGRISMITAASGFGKTKLAINIALAIAEDKKSVYYFNMEMTRTDFVAMTVQHSVKIRNDDWADGSFITEFNMSLINKLIDSPPDDFYFTGGNSLTAIDIIGSIYSKRPDFVIIDYDQKIVMDGSDEWFAMLKTIEKLEDAAKTVGCHVILLAQAGDDGDIKSSKRSKQPASAVLNFYKDGLNNYYIKSIKNRYGSPFVLEVEYNPATTTVKELNIVGPEQFKKQSPEVIKSVWTQYPTK